METLKCYDATPLILPVRKVEILEFSKVGVFVSFYKQFTSLRKTVYKKPEAEMADSPARERYECISKCEV